MLLLESKIGEIAYHLLVKIQNIRGSQINTDISYNEYSDNDLKIINGNNEIKNSIFLRYFPICLVEYFSNEISTENKLNTFKGKLYQPNLEWNMDMKTMMIMSLSDRISAYLCNCLQPIDAHELIPISAIPIYGKKLINPIKYPKIEENILCQNINLNSWISGVNNVVIDDNQKIKLVVGLNEMLCKIDDTQSYSKMITILKSCYLAHKRFHQSSVNFVNGLCSTILRQINRVNSTGYTILKICYRLLILEVYWSIG